MFFPSDNSAMAKATAKKKKMEPPRELLPKNYQISKGLLYRNINDTSLEVLRLDKPSEILILEDSSATIWKKFKTPKNLKSLMEELAEEFEVDLDEAEALVAEAVREFQDLCLIEKV